MRHNHEIAEDPDALLTTGEMARRSMNTLRTVRFYEEEGILRPIRRTEGGHRLFDKAELERLMLVSDLRAAGLSLDEIKDVLALKSSSPSASAAAEHATLVLTERMAELRDKLATLMRLEADLAATTESLRRCAECDGRFPAECASCGVVRAEPSPRALRVLWAKAPVAAAPAAK